MRTIRSTMLALTPLFVILVTAQAGLAQSPAPTLEKGVCAPWHRCLAIGTLGLAVVAILALGAGYLIQRRGFDKIEHRQGSPEGVEVE